MIAGVKARRRRISTRPPAGDEPAFLARIVVTPSSLSVAVDETAQLAVAGLDQYDGDYDLTGLTVSWSSSVPGKAAVDSNGLVTGVAGGSTVVTASIASAALSATCDVECVTPAAVVDHVVVSPTSLTLTEGGGTSTLTADPQDASNNSLVGRTVTWASDATGVATVDSSGVVSPVAAGSANITATCETVDSDPVPVTVNAAAPSGHPNEPSGMTAVTEVNFLSLAELSSAGWTLTATDRLSFEVQAALARSTTMTGVATYPTGFAGGAGPINVSKSFSQSTTIYHDFDLMLSGAFEGHNAGVNKVWFLAAQGSAASPFYYSCQGVNQGGLTFQVRLQACPKSLGGNTSSGAQNISSGVAIVRGVAYRIEVVATMNTMNGSTPNEDGVLQVWINGVQCINRSNMCYRGGTGVLSGTAGFNLVKWNPTWGGTGDNVTTEQYMYMGYAYLSRK